MNKDARVLYKFIAVTLASGLLVASNTAIADDLLGTTATTSATTPTSVNMEKCYGIAKAGMNDCDSSAPSICDKSVLDADPNYWIYVPKGLCNKIVGGSTNIGPTALPTINLPASSTTPTTGTTPSTVAPSTTTSPTGSDTTMTPATAPNTTTPAPATTNGASTGTGY